MMKSFPTLADRIGKVQSKRLVAYLRIKMAKGPRPETIKRRYRRVAYPHLAKKFPTYVPVLPSHRTAATQFLKFACE